MSLVKSQFLVLGLAFGAVLLCVVALSDPPSIPLLVAIVVIAMTAIGASIYALRSQVARPLADLEQAISSMRSDGDLSRRVETGCSETRGPASAFNGLIASFQSIIGKVYFSSDQLAQSAAALSEIAQRVDAGSVAQREAAEQTTCELEQMTASMGTISANVSQAADNALQARGLSERGAEIAASASDRIGQVARSIEDSARAIAALGARTHSIGSIVGVIREVAEQTNRLALNAAIEAARAGEQGRGFAVVADEVRKLAERTSAATAEISGLIESIQRDTDAAVKMVHEGAKQSNSGAEAARQAAAALESINQGACQTQQAVGVIAAAIAQQSEQGQRVVRNVLRISDLTASNSELVRKTLHEVRQVAHLSVNLREIDTVFRLGEFGDSAKRIHDSMPAIVQQAAQEIGRVLSQALANKRIVLEDLFDERYVPIANTRPQKFSTKFDRLTDDLFPPIQEEVLTRNQAVVYAGAVDRNGYFPTHNRRFSQPLTGDEKVDVVHNRTKRIFSDPVGKRCGSHQLPFLIQTYRRDTGEIMHDISAPIVIEGRQWGGFRIGYQA